jgi:hypothetical protein
MEPDLHESLTERRRLGGNPNVAREREIAARTGGHTVHGSDHDLWQRADARDDSGSGLEKLPERITVVVLLKPGHERHIAPRAERPSGPRDDDRADLVRRGDLVEPLEQFVTHPARERVQFLRPVQSDRRNPIRPIDEYGLHPLTPSLFSRPLALNESGARSTRSYRRAGYRDIRIRRPTGHCDRSRLLSAR